jgi:hypothetical protein
VRATSARQRHQKEVSAAVRAVLQPRTLAAMAGDARAKKAALGASPQ